MHEINCSVETCIYNMNKVCGASQISVGEEGAEVTEATCCKTFTSKQDVNNQMDMLIDKGSVESIQCSVNTCGYNAEHHCTLNSIEIGSLKEAENFRETDCLSFDRK